MDGETVRYSDAFVVGTIASVEEGRSFLWTETDDAEQRVEVDFNAPNAMVSTIHLTLKVDAAVMPLDDKAPSEVTIGVALDAPVDVETAAAQFSSGARFAILLWRSSAVFDYDPSLWAIVNDGQYLGTVDTEGVVAFPAFDHGVEADDKHRSVDSADAVNGLRIEDILTAEPPAPTQLVLRDGVWAAP